MNDSDSEDRRIMDGFGVPDDWRRSKNGGKTDQKTDNISEASSRRHFQERFQYGEQTTRQSEFSQRKVRSSNNRFSDRDKYSSQSTNSRNPQYKPHSFHGNSSIAHTSDWNNHNIRYFNVDHLESLSKMNSNELATELEEQQIEFGEFLNRTSTRDMLVLTMSVLVKLCQGNSTKCLTSILSHVCSDTFLKNLESHLTSLCFEKESQTRKHNKLYWNNRNGFWNNLTDIFRKIIDLLPYKARDELTGIIGKIECIITSIENNQDYVIDKNVKKTVSNMFDELQQQLKKFEPKEVTCKTESQKVDEEPPENFRFLSIIPRKKDLLDRNPFIRANKVKGAYDSVEHYLDVQFRLLREDFIAPLHDGLDEYLNDTTKHRNQNLRIYRKVKFVAQKTCETHSGYKIFFGIKKFDWRDSKRLMFGTLLCLSRDNFDTILFATVSNSNEFDLRKGLLIIQPCHGTEITRDFYDYDYVMLESRIYFEPYSLVLSALQGMTERNFPMKNYLIDADTSTRRPRYLNEQIIFQYKRFQWHVAADKPWPSPEALQLDEMQYQAFKCALTQEIAVIQGPPGTGKTFLASQIIGTILQSRLNCRDHGPILIVCLTNHALDQFLERIMNYTDSIIRIGNRSKNPDLKRYTLKYQLEASKLISKYVELEDLYDSSEDYSQWKRKNRHLFERPTGAQQWLSEMSRELNDNLYCIEKTYKLIQSLTKEDAIIPLWQLKKFCRYSDDELTTDRELLIRLLGDNFSFITAEDLMHTNNELELPWKIRLLNRLLTPTNDKLEIIFPLDCIDELITELDEQIVVYRNQTEMNELPFDPTNEWQCDIHELLMLRSSLQEDLAGHPLVNMGKGVRSQHSQWNQYWEFITSCYEDAMATLHDLQVESNILNECRNKAKQRVDLEVLRERSVVGLTTTAAARLRRTPTALHAPIVLVEEAAEILEAQVVCSLTKSCEHLILIGDHKQLRPKPAVYDLGTKYNLNISLFERMVNIREDCIQLTNQHRMRPEISRLISPSIYETLHNDKSVCKYPSVKGLDKNVFFWNHTHEEVSSEHNEDSWSNPHEAKFLVALARHLILQGYNVSEITILCTYAGQLSTLTKEKDRHRILSDLRVTTVDNYQGEENRIILLSLVRNNKEGNIGFLKEENRVCVALSRAREGLYMMGNMDNLTTKNHIWPKIKKVLEDHKEIGDGLEIRCQNHPEESIMAQDAKDFEKCPEGGCSKKCHADLPCGHICLGVCHVRDQEHEYYKCNQPCVRTCPRMGHPCPLMCYKNCDCRVIDDRELKCGHTVPIPCGRDPTTFPCPVMVNTILPDCSHEVMKPCYKSVTDYQCSHFCEIALPCGHTCGLKCHVNKDPYHLEYKCKKNCEKNNLNCTMDHNCDKQCSEECTPCDVEIKKGRSCGHYSDCKCSQDVEEILCTKPCKREMACGHMCQLRCDENCGICRVEVEKTSSCGHKIKVKCNEEATPSKCNSQCQRELACGHLCTAKCKDLCIETCKVMAPQNKPGLCGHIFSVPCYMQESGDDPLKLLKYCKEPCKTELACGHVCKGNCGLCKQGRIHIRCGKNCGKIVIPTEKIIGDQTELQNQRQLLLKEIELLGKNPVLKVFSDLKNFLDILHTRVLSVAKKKNQQVQDARIIETTRITVNILQQIFEELHKVDHTVEIYPWLQDQILMLLQLLSIKGQISNQEINDIRPELRRLHYMAEVCKMNSKIVLKDMDSLEDEIPFKTVIEKLTSIEKFSETTELDIKNEMSRLESIMETKIAIIDAERQMILKAFGFPSAHYLK